MRNKVFMIALVLGLIFMPACATQLPDEPQVTSTPETTPVSTPAPTPTPTHCQRLLLLNFLKGFFYFRNCILKK